MNACDQLEQGELPTVDGAFGDGLFPKRDWRFLMIIVSSRSLVHSLPQIYSVPIEDTRPFDTHRGQQSSLDNWNMECETDAMDGIFDDTFGQGTPVSDFSLCVPASGEGF